MDKAIEFNRVRLIILGQDEQALRNYPSWQVRQELPLQG